ncbi:hypothetical protein ACSBR1_031689 [Camellia fascicularis]
MESRKCFPNKINEKKIGDKLPNTHLSSQYVKKLVKVVELHTQSNSLHFLPSTSPSINSLIFFSSKHHQIPNPSINTFYNLEFHPTLNLHIQMAVFNHFSRFLPFLAIALAVLTITVHGQVQSPCTASMLSTFTSCMNFITNSTANGTTPTPACCNSLKSLMSNGTGCLCLIATGSVPFQIPINRTLAISLPRACNMPGVPLKCNCPIAFSPTVSPGAPSLSPTGSTVPTPVSPALAPGTDTTSDLTPSPPTVASDAPTSNSGIRPVVTPSAAGPSHSFSLSLLMALFGAMALKYFY